MLNIVDSFFPYLHFPNKRKIKDCFKKCIKYEMPWNGYNNALLVKAKSAKSGQKSIIGVSIDTWMGERPLDA